MKNSYFVMALICLFLITMSSSKAQMKVQTGTWNADKNISNYMLDAGGEMERTLSLNISFPKPFVSTPEITFSITRYDGDANINVRYDAKIVAINKTGFRLEVKTWGGSKINLIGGTWMAIGE